MWVNILLFKLDFHAAQPPASLLPTIPTPNSPPPTLVRDKCLLALVVAALFLRVVHGGGHAVLPS